MQFQTCHRCLPHNQFSLLSLETQSRHLTDILRKSDGLFVIKLYEEYSELKEGVTQGSVFGSVLYLLVTMSLWLGTY